jgi:hypothetical protein
MDRELKGLISEHIEKIMEQKDLTERAKWALEAIKAHYILEPDEELDKMLVVAYVLGSAMSIIIDSIGDCRYNKKLDEWNYQKIFEIAGKKDADEWYADKSIGKKTGETIKIEITEEDFDNVRADLDMIVAQLKMKINQEYALKKAKQNNNSKKH